MLRGNLRWPLDFQPGRTVKWFSRQATIQLSQIIRWVNCLHLERSSLSVLAAIISATAREVSYCRKDQWKLHRMCADQRRRHRLFDWSVFKRRLRAYLEEYSNYQPLIGSLQVGGPRLGEIDEGCDAHLCLNGGFTLQDFCWNSWSEPLE